jgi:hypothetical protein
MSLEAVSRAFRSLTESGIVKSRDLHHLTILDRRGLKRMEFRSSLQTTHQFSSGTTGFAAPEDAKMAVCVLPGTELAFAALVLLTQLIDGQEATVLQLPAEAATATRAQEPLALIS